MLLPFVVIFKRFLIDSLKKKLIYILVFQIEMYGATTVAAIIMNIILYIFSDLPNHDHDHSYE